MKKTGMLLLSLLLAGCMTVAWSAQQAQRAVAEKVVRLHVLANSDSESDQKLKFAVRDAVLSAAEEKLERCKNRDDAEAVICAAIPELKKTAEEVLAMNASNYAVHLEISRETYPKRSYETFSLPAGEYLSLQVVIGEGAGKNWWCVVFPPLCLAATTEEVAQTALQSGLEEDEITLMTEETIETVVRFKVLDLLSNWLDR